MLIEKLQNKKTILGLAAICALGFIACQPEGQQTETSAPAEQAVAKASQTPEEVAKEFLDAFFVKRDIAGAYQYVSKADKQVKSEAQYVEEKSQFGWNEMIKTHGGYSIKKSEITPDKAIFSVTAQVLDIELLFKEALGGQSLLALANMKKEEVSKLGEKNLAKYKDGKTPVPMTDLDQTVEFIKEDGNWRVNMGWADEAKAKQSQNRVLGLGQFGVLMSDPEKGNVKLKANSVKFSSAHAKPGMVLCIVNLTVSNEMKGQFTEQVSTPLTGAAVLAQGGNKYTREFLYAPEIIKDINIGEPLNPGKSITGDIAFQVDKGAKGLKLVFDAGHTPLETYDHKPGRSLNIELGNVSL